MLYCPTAIWLYAGGKVLLVVATMLATMAAAMPLAFTHSKIDIFIAANEKFILERSVEKAYQMEFQACNRKVSSFMDGQIFNQKRPLGKSYFFRMFQNTKQFAFKLFDIRWFRLYEPV